MVREPKRAKIPCSLCEKRFLPYPDGKGGDVGDHICQKCSHHKNLDIDRTDPKKAKLYLDKICQFYNVS
jgi:hypothetical protein